MATRGIYIFEDKIGEFKVYKHWDNYPEGALEFIKNAMKFAFKLPRFEADEFACAFIAANKEITGDMRLLPAHIDEMGQDYTYRITCPSSNYFKKHEELIIEFEDIDPDENPIMFKGTIEQMELYVKSTNRQESNHDKINQL